MKKLFELDFNDYTNDMKVNYRVAVRAIIKLGDKYALIKSKKFNEYKFPGGGVKVNETLHDALVREVLEETGLMVIKHSIKNYGYVVEKKLDSVRPNTVFNHTSNYFICDVEDKKYSTNMDNYEIEYGYQLEYVTLDDAIENNETQADKACDWLVRDTNIMKMLR